METEKWNDLPRAAQQVLPELRLSVHSAGVENDPQCRKKNIKDPSRHLLTQPPNLMPSLQK